MYYTLSKGLGSQHQENMFPDGCTGQLADVNYFKFNSMLSNNV